MMNTNRSRNPSAAEPTRQSGQVAGKRPTASSPSPRHTRYDLGKRKDPPESLPTRINSSVILSVRPSVHACRLGIEQKMAQAQQIWSIIL